MRMWKAAALLWVGLATGAEAQGFIPMQNDQAVMGAINQMASTLGGICQSGNPPACQMYNYIMQNANAMMGASNACQAGNPMGCQYYAQYYQQMDYDYGSFTRQMGAQAQMPSGGYNPLGNTHEERMQAIQNFGNQNTQNWQNHMNRVEQNHQQFLNYLNQ